MTVDTDAEAEDGWVAVKYKGQTAYVSADYVTTELALGEAVTIEEEKAALAKKAEEEAARKTQNVSHPMLNNISDSESDCYEEATIVNNTQPFQFIHLPPPPVQPQSKQSTYRSPAPHSTPPSPPIEKEKVFIDKLLMNLRIRSGCHVALSVRIHL